MSPVRSGYRLVYMAEVKPACEALRTRDTPLARELCDTLEDEWERHYAMATARTAFRFYPPPAARELLAEVLADVRLGGVRS